MSFDDSLSSSSSDSRPATEVVGVELDVRFLDSLLEGSGGMHAEDSELLARLESADTMATGIEARLDEILGTLDHLLTGLKQKDSDRPQEATIRCSELQSGPPPSEQT